MYSIIRTTIAGGIGPLLFESEPWIIIFFKKIALIQLPDFKPWGLGLTVDKFIPWLSFSVFSYVLSTGVADAKLYTFSLK
jgi:hypothetical protein